MTDQQEKHLSDIKAFFTESADRKYRKGQAEHGGNLWERDTVKDIADEAVDQVTYIFVELQKSNKRKLVCYNWRSGHIKADEAMKQISDIEGI